MSILINITSYNRLPMLNNLLKQLKGNDIIVWDDKSSFKIVKSDVAFHRFRVNHGKKLAWKKFKYIFETLKETDYKYYFILPDDIELCDDFINKAINIWESIKDDKKICLSFSNPNRCTKQQFTYVEPKEVGNVILTGWVDMMFMFTKDFLKEIEIDEIPLSRWNENELLGSGIGSQISNKLVNVDYNLYNCKNKMVEHLGNDNSLMNPIERKNNPL